MKQNTKEEKNSSCLGRAIVTVCILVLFLVLTVNLYQPDRPIASITPGSPAGPTFAAQIIRPRQGLPFAGLVPPQYFGVDAELKFDSSSEQAGVTLTKSSLELFSTDWEVRIYFDDQGNIQGESEAVFNMIFEDEIRRVRCSPGNPIEGSIDINELNKHGGFSGSFNLKLPLCQDAESGANLGLPPQPLVLRGVFDKLGIPGDPIATASDGDADF